VLHALWPRVDVSEREQAHGLLGPRLSTLFDAMELRDQRHSLAVAARLRARDIEDRDLLVAALLHDCGKGRVPVALRVLKVLSPGILRRLAAENGLSWRRAAFRLRHHAALGARLAAAAGASAAAVRLISGDIEPAQRESLALLLAADDAS
jgi:hypothetical protein